MTEQEPRKMVYSTEELRAKINSPEVREDLMHYGAHIVLNLLAGPSQWVGMPPLAMTIENAREARKIVANDPTVFAASAWIDTQKSVVNFMLEMLWEEFAAWAEESGRSDLLCNAVDLMNAALPPEEQVH